MKRIKSMSLVLAALGAVLLSGCTSSALEGRKAPKELKIRCPIEAVRGNCGEIPPQPDELDIDLNLKLQVMQEVSRHCYSVVQEWRIRYDECRKTMDYVLDKLEDEGILKFSK